MKLLFFALVFFSGTCLGNAEPPKLPKDGISIKDLRKMKKKYPLLRFSMLYEEALKKKYLKTIKRINKYIDKLKKTLNDTEKK